MDGIDAGTIEFGVINTGGARTDIVASRLTAKLVESPSDISASVSSFAVNQKTFAPGESDFQIFQMDKTTSRAIHWLNQQHKLDPVLAYGKTIVFFGFIKYRDDAGILRTTGIFRQYDPSKLRFTAVTDPDLEYTD